MPHRPDFYNYTYNFEKGFSDVKSKAHSCYRKDLTFLSYDGWCGDFGFHPSDNGTGYYKSTSWNSDFLNKYFKVIGQTDLLNTMRKKDYWQMGSQQYIDYEIMSLFWKKVKDMNARYETFSSQSGLMAMDTLIKDKTGKYAFDVINDDIPGTIDEPYRTGYYGPIKTPMNVDNVPSYLQSAVSAFNEPTIQYKIVSSNYLKQIYWYGLFVLMIFAGSLLWFGILELALYRLFIYIVYGKK